MENILSTQIAKVSFLTHCLSCTGNAWKSFYLALLKSCFVVYLLKVPIKLHLSDMGMDFKLFEMAVWLRKLRLY
jgi:hypothetical protein